MYCEYEAVIHALPPQVAIIGPLEPNVFRRFTAWFLFAYSTTLVAHRDLATTSFFLAKVLATERCGAMASIEHAWEDVFSKSVLTFLASHIPTFASLCFGSSSSASFGPHSRAACQPREDVVRERTCQD